MVDDGEVGRHERQRVRSGWRVRDMNDITSWEDEVVKMMTRL
jgi:hypothetical protein